MRKYRILYDDGLYHPQYRRWGIFWFHIRDDYWGDVCAWYTQAQAMKAIEWHKKESQKPKRCVVYEE